MSEPVRRRRTRTARELADERKVSERFIRSRVAERREDYEGRAAARRDEAARLRAEGSTYREIADALGCSVGTVGRLLHEYRERAGIPQPGRGRRSTTIPMPKAAS